MPVLPVDINEDCFVRQVKDGLGIGASSLHELLSEALKSEIGKSVARSFDDGQLMNVKVTENGSPSTHSLKEAIDSGGYPFWYVKTQIDLIPGVRISESDLNVCGCIRLDSVRYGDGSKTIKFRHKEMKTRERYLAELIHPVILAGALEKIRKEIGEKCNCDDSLLRPVKHGVWEWLQQFGCINCGSRYICDCFRPAVEKHLEVVKQQQASYSSSGWPHRFLRSFDESEYRAGICHLCTGKPSNLFFCHPMYGSPVRVKYGAYMRKFEIQDELSERDAENKIREMLGIPKVGEGWVSETQLFRLVESLFSEHEVIREASPDWLGKQRLDVFIPDLALAIEYQGEQHYRPVALFGGEEGLKKTKERDKLKLKLCRDNGIKVVYFSHKEDLSQSKVEKKLIRELRSAERR